MRKDILLFLFVLIISAQIQAQNVGIGTSSPNASARLDISDTTRGILIPRMTATQRDAIIGPASGLLVFITDDNSFYYFNNSWQKLMTGNTGWGLSGNAGIDPATQFIGTTDPQPLRFRVNNLTAGQINAGDFNTGLGVYTLNANQTGVYNVSLGAFTLSANVSGSSNVAIGSGAMQSNLFGSYNIAMGLLAGTNNQSGNGNVLLGTYSNTGTDGLTNATAIGYSAIVSQSNSIVLGGTGANAVNVGIGTDAPREKLDVKGVVTITNGSYGVVNHNANFPAPAGGAGTILFSNNHFFGWNGFVWKQLDN